MQVVGGADRTMYTNGKALEGQTLHEALPEGLASRFLGLINQTLETGEPQTLEYPLRNADVQGPVKRERRSDQDHRLQWFEGRIVPLPEYDHPIPCVLWVAVNITHRKQMEDELRRLATTDTLTGVSNRRHLLEQAENEIRRARRYGHPLTVLLLDVDHFKRVNDTFGHRAGDKVLQRIAQVCADRLRDSDVFGRTGGEEFVAMLPETDAAGAEPLANRLRQAVADLELPEPMENFGVSISVGGAQLQQGDNVDSLIGRADQALYAAKRQGRNRYRFKGPSSDRDAR